MIVYPAYAYMGKKKPDLTKYAFYGYKDSYYAAPWASLFNGAEYAIDDGVYRVKLDPVGSRFQGSQIPGVKIVITAKCKSSFSAGQSPITLAWYSASGSGLEYIPITPTKDYSIFEFAVRSDAASFRIFRNIASNDPVFLDQIHFE